MVASARASRAVCTVTVYAVVGLALPMPGFLLWLLVLMGAFAPCLALGWCGGPVVCSACIGAPAWARWSLRLGAAWRLALVSPRAVLPARRCPALIRVKGITRREVGWRAALAALLMCGALSVHGAPC